MLDHEVIDLRSGRFQPQPQLFLDRRKQRGARRIERRRVVGARSRRKLARVRSPGERHVKEAADARSIDDVTNDSTSPRP